MLSGEKLPGEAVDLILLAILLADLTTEQR